MRRILLSCVAVAVLLLPAAASARAAAHARSKPGYLVVRKAAGDGGVNGNPVVTVVLRKGFVLGRVSVRQEARVDIYHLQSAKGEGTEQTSGADIPGHPAPRWHGLPGVEYSGTKFRFSAIGGFYRVVVRGAGIYLFAGGRGTIKLRGSSFSRNPDGSYALNGAGARSLPSRPRTFELGRG
jgi:hypothetical protein